MGWVDNIKHWIDGGLEVAREIVRLWVRPQLCLWVRAQTMG